MKGMGKKAAYLLAVLLVGVFGYAYAREHNLILHHAAGASRPGMITYLGLLVMAALALGSMCAFDVSRFVRSRAEGWILEGAASTEPVPEMQEAERIRASGEPLDAIRLLREYLQANPYELQAMARIAEIYRYDLKNDLAAALEYEELLKHKVPDDQWAWAALHLAKLYGRLNDLEKSVALLERLDNEYGHTIAGRRAKKALERMRDPEAPNDADEAETQEKG
jgi:tetratricopeptide (TPR) repeat protein